MSTLKFATISGSLRRESFSTMIAETISELVPEGSETVPAEIRDLPFYNEDLKDDGSPASVRILADTVNGADAVVIVSPEYNRATTAVLKNALDWLSKEPDAPFKDKPVLIITQSPGATGGILAGYDLRQVLSVMGARIVPGFEVTIGSVGGKVEGGKLTDEATRDFVAGELKRLAAMV